MSSKPKHKKQKTTERKKKYILKVSAKDFFKSWYFNIVIVKNNIE